MTITERRVFISYPRGTQTGGPEALHQLASTLRKLGADTFLVPQPGTQHEQRVSAYEHYDVLEAPEVVDAASSIVVAAETSMNLLRSYSNAQRICWWLSIDNSPLWRAERQALNNWSRDGRRLVSPSLYRRAASITRKYGLSLRGDYRALGQMGHLAQSAYAKSFLYAKANVPSLLVSDWTRLPEQSVWEPTDSRAIISYNPKKAQVVTEALQREMREVHFVPLTKMTPHEVGTTLRKTSIYLDLGYHPGKDRMPREAAMHGAVSIVARRGSGAFDEDVPIPAHHKVPIKGDVVRAAQGVIRAVLSDPQSAWREQEHYRQCIRNERETFISEVTAAFSDDALETILR